MNEITSSKSVKNTIILAPGLNGSELLRSMAKLGHSTIGMRIVGGEELARIALMHSGHTIQEKYLSSDEEAAILYSILQDEGGYFENANSYSDAVKIAGALRTIRGSLDAQDYSEEITQMRDKLCGEDAEFPEKNNALVGLYVKYVDKCEEWGTIDSIGIIRRALYLAKEMEDADLSVLNEYPITAIEEALIWKLSSGNYGHQDLPQLLDKEKSAIRISDYTRAYGISNEIEDIIEKIYRDKEIRPDQCTVACANPRTHSQYFFDASRRYDVPMTFGMGLPITNSLPGEFLELLDYWAGNGGYGVVAFEKLLKSSAFNDAEFYKTVGVEDSKELKGKNDKKAALASLAGQLKISFDDAMNRERIAAYKPVLEKEAQRAEASIEKRKKYEVEAKNLAMAWLEKMLDDLSSGPIAFFDKYAMCREYGGLVREFDKSAKATIMSKMIAFAEVDGEESPLTIAPEILGQSVYRQSSKPGHIHVTGISGATSVIRDKLFVCGLSADNFPGNPRENYLILDTDHELLRPSEDRDIVRDDSSRGVVERNKSALDHLLAVASSLDEDVFLSYSGYDTAELKDNNPSSVLYEYYREGNEDASYDKYMECFNRVGFFDAALSESREIARKFVNNERIKADPEKTDIYEKYSKDDLMKKAWSPSALDMFFQCPRRFYLEYVRGIANESEDDMFSLMEGPATGNLAHDLMEDLANTGIANVSRDEFGEWARKAIDDYFLGRIPINKKDAMIEADRFVEILQTAYDRELEQGRTVLEAEKVIEHKHPCGIKLKGYPDRVEETSAGECIVTDFKTKRTIEHEPNDIDSCLQVVIYAWLYEQEYGRPISRCEYKYLRYDRVITCRFDEEMKKLLAEKLDIFKEALESHVFDRNPGEKNKNCKYCQFVDICDNDYWPNADAGEESDDK